MPILFPSTRIEARLLSDTATLVDTAPEADTPALDTFAKAATPPATFKKSRLCIVVLSFFSTVLMPSDYSKSGGKRNSKVGTIAGGFSRIHYKKCQENHSAVTKW
jgi:hypothetical protein